MNLDTLKAFSTINNGIVLKKGQNISTIAEEGNIYAESTETAEFDIGIYDLQSFLGTLSLTSSDRNITPTEENGVTTLSISDGKTKFKYIGAVENLITQPPADVTPLTELPTDNAFELSSDDLKKLKTAMSVMNANTIKMSFAGSDVTISTINTDSNDESNSMELTLPCNVTSEMTCTITKESLKLPHTDYNVEVSEKAVAFKSSDMNIFIVRSDV